MVERDCIENAAAAVTPPRCVEDDLIWVSGQRGCKIEKARPAAVNIITVTLAHVP
jgi:hypothetical protein